MIYDVWQRDNEVNRQPRDVDLEEIEGSNPEDAALNYFEKYCTTDMTEGHTTWEFGVHSRKEQTRIYVSVACTLNVSRRSGLTWID